jgi:hypothetical protein
MNIKNDEWTEIPLHLRFTYANETFLFFSEEKQMNIFTTSENLEYLKNSRCWIADGTFLAAPLEYDQLYVLYGFVFKKCVPLVYIIMTSKTQSEYKKAFSIIFDYLEGYNPKEIIIDN